MTNLKVGIAMSGGVDSTVAAALLKEQGHEVHGFFMLLPLPGLEEQIKRVTRVAGELDFPLHLVDLRDSFSGTVISYFIQSYRQGKTPNPCVVCNQKIKFGALLDAILDKGMDRAATGHYARVLREDNQSFLHRGMDATKDQSYFLCRLAEKNLQHLTLPLGEWTKKEVHAKAHQLEFTELSLQESQDVCFLPQGLGPFLRCHGVNDRRGEIVTTDGQCLGNHRGIWHYTVGQRRGLGLPDATPWYVVGLGGNDNQVIIGKNLDLFKSTVALHDLRWNGPVLSLPWQGLVQLRSRHRAAPASLTQNGPDSWTISFKEPQRAITPGQFAVLYREDRIVGSGVITAP
ncbi:MAG: tRNA 2-thiouridine(34) synthase MnmA [Desulfobulbaceae bacterium]|nr:tRNA 2-thiouridine(34) synthase MnmA [Desulfobulbaceae bacterium]